METSYRNKIQEIRKCLEVLDNPELSKESIDLLEKSWAALMIAAANQKETITETKHSLVFLKTRTENGNIVLELSKADLNREQQITFDKFMSSCKEGEICEIANEDECAEKYKEIRNILGYED